ncbi:MAG TPA: SulP family inorganic anion transporter [Anaerolineales bacterium]|nr:SulP family inorganic anion transporter [Anaerolineales bacterium]
MDIAQVSEPEPEVEQPGLSRLREAVANAAQRGLPARKTFVQDALAGVNSTIGSAPDAMANAILAGVNPLYGLYAAMIGPAVGALFTSTQLIIISSTSAAALATNQSLGGLTGEARDRALFLMVVLIGVFQIVLGLLRAGQLTRFVSYSVMTGFLSGVAGLMVFSQFTTVTGIGATGSNKLSQALSVIANIREIDLLTIVTALITLLLIIILPRTPLGNLGTLVALIIPSLLVGLMQWDSVQTVQDVGEILRGFPKISLPSFSDLSPGMITGALAVALIIIVQGAGVSQSVPNPDGTRRSVSRDIIAQGAANLTAGLFRGVPVGGSLSSTALSVVAGSRTRWAAILSGLWMALLVLLAPGLIGYVAMPALGALLIYAGLQTIKPQEWLQIWEIGWPSRLASISTFLATLTLPVEVAVAIGVILSALLYLYESSADISIVELVELPDGRIEEHKRPKHLKDHQITVLDIYGQLFYASARTLGRLLPSPKGASNPVVILRLRGHTKVGATLIDVLAEYAQKLKEVNGRLYLSGMSELAYQQLRRAGKLSHAKHVHTYDATAIRGQSTRAAIAHAQEWLISQSEGSPLSDRPPGEALHENKG